MNEKRNPPKPETRGPKNTPSFPRPVSSPVSKKCPLVSISPRENKRKRFLGNAKSFPIDYVSFPQICTIGVETRPLLPQLSLAFGRAR